MANRRSWRRSISPTAIAQHDRRQLYLRLWLEVGGQTVSQQTVFFTAPRFLNLRRAPIQSSIHAQHDGAIEIEFSSPVFQHSVEFDLAGTDYRASDNFFELYPNVPHRVHRARGEPDCGAAGRALDDALAGG